MDNMANRLSEQSEEVIEAKYRLQCSGDVQEQRQVAAPQEGNMDNTDPENEVYDFGDPRRIIVTIIMMAFTVFTANAACNKIKCSVLDWPIYPSMGEMFDAISVMLYAGWIIYIVVTYYVIPGKMVIGQPLACGKRLVYTCNGFCVFALTLALYMLSTFYGLDVNALYDRLYSLMTFALLTAVTLSVYLYWRASGITQEEKSQCGNTGFALYDFYLGKELNPRIGNLDLKFLCELRPGLMAWILLDVTYLIKAIHEEDEFPTNLLLITLCHTLYVADALYFEEAVLTTLDITREGFGFMLVFGDLVWVPFLFSLQARFLLEHPQRSPPVVLAMALLANGVGYWIFRAANNEKDKFRNTPADEYSKDLRTLCTADGKSLLVSGWWSLCRHPNYLGDIIMSLSWATLCGFGHLLPWFYPLYLCGTLVHRCERDDRFCRQKYGGTWSKYCRLVPHKIIPGMY